MASVRSQNSQALNEVDEDHADVSTQKDIGLFGKSFCPYLQRIWIALEHLKLNYNFNEFDPNKKLADLLAGSPKGVPALKLHNAIAPISISESSAILDYLEDLSYAEHPTSSNVHLLPPLSENYARYLLRQQAYHINNAVVPAFYRYLQARTTDEQRENGKSFMESIIQLITMFEAGENILVNAGSPGLWGALGERQPQRLNFADVMVAPWLFRATNILKHYRGFLFPPSSKFQEYLQRLLNHPDVKTTCNDPQLYLNHFQNSPFNRP